MSLLAFDNIFLDPSGASVVYQDVGGSFEPTTPLLNMSKMQLPIFAQFVGETASFTATISDAQPVSVFGLLGHTLTNGMTVSFYDTTDAPNLLGSIVVANHRGLAQHVILTMGSAVSLKQLRVDISGGSIGTIYRIGALWASQSFRHPMEVGGYDYSVTSLSDVSYASATGYAAARDSQESPSAVFPLLSRADAIGPAYPNARAIFREIGYHSPVIIVPDESKPALSTYGLVDSFVGPTATVEQLWRAGVVLKEQR